MSMSMSMSRIRPELVLIRELVENRLCHPFIWTLNAPEWTSRTRELLSTCASLFKFAFD
jgi:hypothetical protein